MVYVARGVKSQTSADVETFDFGPRPRTFATLLHLSLSLTNQLWTPTAISPLRGPADGESLEAQQVSAERVLGIGQHSPLRRNKTMRPFWRNLVVPGAAPAELSRQKSLDAPYFWLKKML